jgi:hypothetical protein
MKRIATLSEPQGSLWRACVEIWLIAFLPSLALFGLGFLLVSTGFKVKLIEPLAPTLKSSMQFLVAAPVVETLVLMILVKLLALTTLRPLYIAIVVGLVFGVTHGFASGIMFLSALWGFFILTIAYLQWRKRSRWHGFCAASLPHALANASFLAIRWAGANAA